ncbi:MAG: methyl-accepting chemotaxis protein [Nitrospirae bacterium]|nr:methyl-accepting chemotaxis protein [Nitrospirota bacterium]
MGRQYFIKKEFQARFIIKFCLIVIMGAIISGIILYASTNQRLGDTYLESLNAIKVLNDNLISNLVYTNLITVTAISIVTIVITLFASHKIAGPLYRLERSTEAIGNGDFTIETRLRENDEITGVASALNEMAGKLRSKMIDIKTDLEEVKDSSADMESAIKDKRLSEKELKKKIIKLSNRIKSLNRAISKFTIL